MKQILVVDDEAGIRELLYEILLDEGYGVKLANNAEEARIKRAEFRPDLVLLDIWMPDTDGITLLKEWAARGQLTMPVIMMSGHGTVDTAVEATRIGAHAFLEKPFAQKKLLAVMSSALSKSTKTDVIHPISLVGRSEPLQKLRSQIDKLKHVTTPVLILSEPGMYDDHIAKQLKIGKGTWLEISRDNLHGLLRNNKRFADSGSNIFIRDIHLFDKQKQLDIRNNLSDIEASGCRLISSSSFGISGLLSSGEFDPDLYSRLAGVLMVVPSLRIRPEDIPELAKLIADREVESGNLGVKEFTTAALNTLRNHGWPGNIVQLEATVKTCLRLSKSDLIDLYDVKDVLEDAGGVLDHPTKFPLDLTLKHARDEFEKIYFQYHLNNEKGSISKVAAVTGVERTHLYRKLKHLGIVAHRRGSK